MMLRPICEECDSAATLEIRGRYYCSKHALEKVRNTVGEIPPVKMVQR